MKIKKILPMFQTNGSVIIGEKSVTLMMTDIIIPTKPSSAKSCF